MIPERTEPFFELVFHEYALAVGTDRRDYNTMESPATSRPSMDSWSSYA